MAKPDYFREEEWMRPDNHDHVDSNNNEAGADKPQIKRELKYRTLIWCQYTRYTVGVLLIALQITLSFVVIYYDKELRHELPYALGYPGIINGLNVIFYAFRYEVSMRLIMQSALAARSKELEKHHFLPSELIWKGLPFKRGVQVVMLIASLASIGLAIAFMALNSRSVRRVLVLISEGRYPVVAETCLGLLICLQICGFISMNTFVEGIKTHLQLQRLCCKRYYPLALYMGPKSDTRPLILL